MEPKLKQAATMAEDVPFSDEARLSLLNTNPAFNQIVLTYSNTIFLQISAPSNGCTSSNK